jgi:4-amino-4-deoxy-L-arabinose transferase-like glycosyltransferase
MAATTRAWLDLDRAPVRHTVAWALALAALLLRLWRLGAQPLWLDEALSAHIAHAPQGLDFVHNTPPLYHWLSRTWAQASGIGPTALRLPSAVFGAAFVWAAFHAGRAAFGNRAAVVTALLALLSPLHIYYSQEARAYALLLVELMVALWLSWRLAAEVRPATWLALVVTSTAALHTHTLAAIPLVLAHLAIPLAAPASRRRRTLGASVAAGAAAVLASLPWFLWWSEHTAFAAEDMRWLALLWAQVGGFGVVATSLELFVLGEQSGHAPIFMKQFTAMPFAAPARLAALVAMVLLLVLGLARLRWLARSERWAMAQCGLLCLGTLLGLWLLSLMRPVYAPGRYDLIAFPAFVLWLGGAIAAGLAARGRAVRSVAGLAAAVLAVCLVAKDWRYFRAEPPPDPNRAVAAHLAAALRDGDAVVLCGGVALPVLVHLYQAGYVWHDGQCRAPDGGCFACRLLPIALERAPAAVSRYLRALDDGSLVADLDRLLPAIRAPVVWLVLGDELHGTATDRATAAVAHRLFDVLQAAGYELVGGESQLGIARLAARRSR